MRAKKANWLLILGAALIFISLCIVLFFCLQMHTAQESATEVLQKIEAVLPERTPADSLLSGGMMPVLQIDGTDYVALLEIPAWDVALPIADNWETRASDYTPARFAGSIYGETLTLGGADAAGHFAFCDQIELGTPVWVTDMTGAQFAYTVARVDRATEANAAWLTDTHWNLTLFCRDTYSMDYIAVRCLFSHRP